jgi:site-specific DNA recombinase
MRHKIGAYVRVSTEEQAAAIDGSPENQRYRLKAFVDLKNTQEKNWGEIVEFYVDDGYSAKDTRRPAYQRMMRDIKRKRIDLIFITDLSRLSRNIFDFCTLMDDLEKVGAEFLSIKEQFDTSTAAGKMMIYNMINLAQFEREQTSERVSLGVHARAMRGLLNGARPILGYDKEPEKPGTYVLNEQEAKDVRKIFRHFLNTGSRAKTIQKLVEEGIEPKLGGNYGSLKINRKWNVVTLGNLLSSAAYIGCHEVNKGNRDKVQSKLKPFQQYKRVKASWPAIVPETDFNNAQKILEEAQKLERVRLSGAAERYYTLSGVLRCQECGSPMVGQASHGALSVHRYYGHTVAGRNNGCKIMRIPANEVETKVFDYIFNSIQDAGYLDHIEENIKGMRNVRSLSVAREKRSLQEQLKNIEARIDGVLMLQGQATNPETTGQLLSKYEALKKDEGALAAKLGRLSDMPDRQELVAESRRLIEERLNEFANGFKKANGAMKKRLLKRVLKQVLLSSEGLTIYMLLADQMDIPNHQIQLVEEKDSAKSEPSSTVLMKKASGDDSKLSVLSSDIGKNGDPAWTRTRDLQLRRLLLYPTELRGHVFPLVISHRELRSRKKPHPFLGDAATTDWDGIGNGIIYFDM